MINYDKISNIENNNIFSNLDPEVEEMIKQVENEINEVRFKMNEHENSINRIIDDEKDKDTFIEEKYFNKPNQIE